MEGVVLRSTEHTYMPRIGRRVEEPRNQVFPKRIYKQVLQPTVCTTRPKSTQRGCQRTRRRALSPATIQFSRPREFRSYFRFAIIVKNGKLRIRPCETEISPRLRLLFARHRHHSLRGPSYLPRRNMKHAEGRQVGPQVHMHANTKARARTVDAQER